MRRSLSVGVFLAALLLLSCARGAEAPLAGTWKVSVLTTLGQELSLLLIKVDPKASAPVELVSGLGVFKGAKLQSEKAAGNALKFSAVSSSGMTYSFVAYPPPGEQSSKKLLGSVAYRSFRDCVRLDRSEDKELDQKTASSIAPAKQDYDKAVRLTDAKEKEEALKSIAEKNSQSPLGLQAQLELAGVLATEGAKEQDVRAAAEKTLQLAAVFGPEMRTSEIAKVAQKFIATKKAPSLAVEYAQQAEKALSAGATVAEQVAALKTLRTALNQSERKDEITKVNERLAKLDKILDEEFLKNAVPFKTEPFQRASSTGRVALVELFTGAQCPPCVAADIAFDAALKTYRPRDVVLLQYHQHIPGPDPLTNEDTEKRFRYYQGRGVPSTFVDGGTNLPLGGGKDAGQQSYLQLTDALKGQLDKGTAAKIDLKARKTGDSIVITAEVSDLKEASEETKLRLALVEEVVRYPGNNGQRFHHHVVRSMPGGVDGLVLKSPKEKQEVKVNLTELKKTLAEYLEKANAKRPFYDDDRPLGLTHLFVVAFIQNDKTKDVIQAVQAEVQNGGK